MSQHICKKCHKDLKYLSTLQRHQANKKDCTRIIISNNIVSNQSNTTASINIEDKEGSNNLIKFATNVLQDTINKAKTNKEKTILFNDFITLFNKNNSNQILSLTNTSISSNASESINVKNVCTDCNHKFYDKQTLNRHTKNGKCKGQNKLPITGITGITGNTNNNTSNNSGISFNDIINSDLLLNADNSTTNNTINNNNNTTNNNITNNTNNTNTNNTNNTNITINLNPFRCESLEHITLEDFKKIYKSINSIDILLCYYLYKRNLDNISFYKNNVNQDIVSVLNEKMEIEKMTDDNFIKELKKNINDSKIELFYNFKNDLSQDEIIKYMKNLIVYHNNFINNEHDKKGLTDIIREILDTAFRDKEKKALINSLLKQLNGNNENNDNNEVKKAVQHKYKEITKGKKHKTNDYYKKPEADNNDPKNLYNIKEGINNGIAEEERRLSEQLAEIRNRQNQENNRDNRDIYI